LLGESTPDFMSDQLAGCRQRIASALGAQRHAEHEQDGRNITIHEALALALDALRCQNPQPMPPDERPPSPQTTGCRPYA
jgi:hypothetical protein